MKNQVERTRASRSDRVAAATVPTSGSLLLVAVLSCTSPASDSVPTSDGATAPPENVLLITIDTLRADALGSYGSATASTPHLDRLAERGHRFSQATTVVPLTLPAHSSLMTATFPATHGVRDNGGYRLEESLTTLAERFQEAGYRTGAFVASFVLDSRWGLDQGFDHYADDFDLEQFEGARGMDAIQRPADEVIDRAIRWLSETSGAPFFAWVHLYDPHTPYAAPSEFRQRFPPTRRGQYDAEVAWTDHQIGRLLDHLDEVGTLDNTLVVVLADHGEMLGEHRELTHGFFIYDAAVRIPLIFAGPGVSTGQTSAQVRIVDVAPTVLSLLGLPPLDETQGVDLAASFRGEALAPLWAHSESFYPRLHYGWSELQSIQDGRFKYIRAPRPELYDLHADPGELDDLSQSDPERLQSLSQRLDQMLEELGGQETLAPPAALDAGTLESLQALGYVGTLSPNALVSDADRADPKDRIESYLALKEAGGAAASGELDEAITRIERVLAEDPGILEAHLLLGNFHRDSGDLGAAREAYERALALDPEHREALFMLAVAHREAGNTEAARVGFERALDLDPKNARARWQLADSLTEAGELESARQILQEGLDHGIDHARFLLKLGATSLELGRTNDALREIESALEQQPDLAGAHYHLGLLFERQRRFGDAIDAYQREIEAHPDALRAHFNVAGLLHGSGQFSRALHHYDRALAIDPEFAIGHLYRARTLLATDELEAAEIAARRGLELEGQLDPGQAPLGHYLLADIYERLGRSGEAQQQAELGDALAESLRP